MKKNIYNEWFSGRNEIDGNVYDFIHYYVNGESKFLYFHTFKSVIYNEIIKDYVEYFTPSLDFIRKLKFFRALNTIKREKIMAKKFKYDEIKTRIYKVLLYKITRDSIAYDKNNMFYMNEIGFGLQRDEKGKTYLIFNVNPMQWNVEALDLTLQAYEDEMYKSANSQHSMRSMFF